MPTSKFRNLYTTLFLVLTLSCTHRIHAQVDSIVLEAKDSLEYYQSKDEYVQYTRYLESKFFDCIRLFKNNNPFEKFLLIYSKHPLWRSPIHDLEKIRYRRVIYLWTNAYRRFNDIDEVYLNKLLEGQKYARDPQYLDKIAWNIEKTIGDYYARKNDYDKSLEYYLKVIPGLIQRKEHNNLIRLYADLANIYTWKNKKAKAKEYVDLYLSLVENADNYKVKRAAYNNARSYFFENGDTLNFKKYYDLAKNLMRTTEDKKNPEYQSDQEVEYSKFLTSKGNYAEALQRLQLADTLLAIRYKDTNRREFAKIDLAIAENYYLAHKNREAINAIQQAYKRLIPSYKTTQRIPNVNQIYDENTIVNLLSLQAKIYKAEYNQSYKYIYLDSISISLLAAIEADELLKGFMIYSDSKVLSTSNTRSLIDREIDNIYRKQKVSPLNQTEFNSLRSLINRSKNTLLNEQIIINKSISLLNDNQKSIIDSLQYKIIYNIGQKTKPNSNLDSLDIANNKIKLTIENIIKENKSKQDLEQSKNYIEYVVTNESIYAVTDLVENKKLIKLGSNHRLHVLINKMNEFILDDKKGKPQNGNPLDTLYQFLFPSNIKLPFQLTIIPDGFIHNIPFDALIHDDQYLIQNHEICRKEHFYSPHTYRGSALNTMYCVSPKYVSNSGEVLVADDNIIYDLKYVNEEIDSIKQTMKIDIKLDSNINSIELLQNLEDIDIFHFAGHAFVDHENAYLALVKDGQIDKMQFDQILNKNIDLDMVTLSACETGLGNLQYGDGINSVGRSFIGAGTKSVIYTLWNVNDQTTSQLIKSFYHYLSEGKSIDASLRKAKLDYLDSNPLEISQPYYWAAFTATGHTHISTDHFNYWPFVLGVFIILVGLIIYIKIK